MSFTEFLTKERKNRVIDALFYGLYDPIISMLPERSGARRRMKEKTSRLFSGFKEVNGIREIPYIIFSVVGSLPTAVGYLPSIIGSSVRIGKETFRRRE